ncbi:HET-domain-containing protein [Canariomyces notabilis]|uniref:HET-domain-containing protein n=1 Tax=Canariomyces notabilis TaxID=2074819 RepID=A0AAN6YVB8_9PEZI|nr:HET-domain-containing protein [Canariomyces arenarius]
MRLINTITGELKEFFEISAPRYAILSHTWGDEEGSFQDMTDRPASLTSKAGYLKIVGTCRVALEEGYEWAWVDSCCIDKSSSAELTESINSMYRWYQRADVCYVFLSDFTNGDFGGISRCRWFTRGWTLQELIAPRNVVFFDKDWNRIGTKDDMVEYISIITGISSAILNHKPFPSLKDLAVAERMSWAANHTTTRPEDRAYSLVGIFDVNMPLIYGEGDKAFERLQEEIIRRTGDLSIFAWEFDPHTEVRRVSRPLPIFASSPADFAFLRKRFVSWSFDRTPWDATTEVNITAHGIRLNSAGRLFVLPSQDSQVSSAIKSKKPREC